MVIDFQQVTLASEVVTVPDFSFAAPPLQTVREMMILTGDAGTAVRLTGTADQPE